MTAGATPPNGKRAGSEGSDQELADLYAKFASANMVPLWTQLDELMPNEPSPQCSAAHMTVERVVPVSPACGRPSAGRGR
jgi:gentisate 1,2-dioxygenase